MSAPPLPPSAPPPLPPRGQGRSNWFLRHKLLTALGALILIGSIAVGSDDSETDSTRSSDNQAGTFEVPADTDARSEPAERRDRDRAKPDRDSDKSHRDREKPHRERVKDAADEDEPGVTNAETPAPRPTKRHHRTYLVTRVVDGDTIELGNGETVRLVGIDTPEVGQGCYAAATAKMERMILGLRVRLSVSDEDRDRYGRLLRYVDVGSRDAGLAQIKSGLAIARYDSRDGYGYHPREDRYIAVDRATPNKQCAEPEPEPPPEEPVTVRGGNCEAGYAPCVPPYPPDVDCADVNGPIRVTGSDPHGLDADGDGTACE